MSHSQSIARSLPCCAPFAFKMIAPADQTARAVKNILELRQSPGSARDYVEVVSRVSCVAADTLTVYSDFIENLTLQKLTTPCSALACIGSTMAGISSKEQIKPGQFLLICFRVQDFYCKASGITINPCSPFLVGYAFDAGLKITKNVFPRHEDKLPFAVFRRILRVSFEEYLEDKGPKAKRIAYVVIPDNLGYAVAIASTYFAHQKYRFGWEDGALVVSMTLTTMAALHFLREQSWIILAPISRKIPLIGQYLAPLLKSLGPSDLRQRDQEEAI